MSVKSIHHLSLQPFEVPKHDPKLVTTNVAQRVFDARPANAIIFRFLSISLQDKMKGVSKSCLKAADDVQREKIYQAIPNDDLWKEIGGIDGAPVLSSRVQQEEEKEDEISDLEQGDKKDKNV